MWDDFSDMEALYVEFESVHFRLVVEGTLVIHADSNTIMRYTDGT